MQRTIDKVSCRETGIFTKEEQNLDKERSAFILRKKIRSVSGRKRLGLAWIIIDPIVTSLIYLFVLTVLKARSDPESLFIGIASYTVLQNSIKSGAVSIRDLTGGFKAERVRTRTMVRSTITYRVIDTFAGTLGVAAILAFAYDISVVGVVTFLLVAQFIGFLFEGIGLSLSLVIKRIPDLLNIINLFLRLMFFAGPVMYPMTATEGLHYKLNLLNPFTYFVEFSRNVAGLESIMSEIPEYQTALVVGICILVCVMGYKGVDRFRWVMTSWS